MIRPEVHAGRFLAATLNVLVGAYLLLMADGVFIAMQQRAHRWEITPLPANPVVRIVVYVTIAAMLQLLSAWLLTPAGTKRGADGFWRRYVVNLVLCTGAALVTAFICAFLVMALLDSGAI
jgi:hypothetical protein